VNRKTEEKPKGALDERTLKEAGEFSIMFMDEKGFKCNFLSADKYNLLVNSNNRVILIPKHSIKYVLLPTSFSP
jgi:sRNA-binding regulator protein Hfq